MKFVKRIISIVAVILIFATIIGLYSAYSKTGNVISPNIDFEQPQQETPPQNDDPPQQETPPQNDNPPQQEIPENNNEIELTLCTTVTIIDSTTYEETCFDMELVLVVEDNSLKSVKNVVNANFVSFSNLTIMGLTADDTWAICLRTIDGTKEFVVSISYGNSHMNTFTLISNYSYTFENGDIDTDSHWYISSVGNSYSNYMVGNFSDTTLIGSEI